VPELQGAKEELMKRVSAIGLVLAVSLVAGGTRSVAANDAHAFEQMKSLVGEWKGTWMPQSNPVEARFYLTGDGSALVEDMKVNSPMSTVYHLDGDELRLTHYCSAGNQPRMKATSVSADGRTIEFELVDVTNLSKTGPRYTHKAKVSLIDEDHAAITYISLRLDGREVSGTRGFSSPANVSRRMATPSRRVRPTRGPCPTPRSALFARHVSRAAMAFGS
jgi:hypothetical protein